MNIQEEHLANYSFNINLLSAQVSALKKVLTIEQKLEYNKLIEEESQKYLESMSKVSEDFSRSLLTSRIDV